MEMTTVRIFYSKTGRAKYISHLDTMRTMTRALRRSGLPLWYTQGFNPHLYITFALPISLGYEGLCESFDIRLVEDISHSDIEKKMAAAMPLGFSVIKAAEPVADPAAIKWADYSIKLIYSGDEAEKAVQSLGEFSAQPAIEVMKKSKKGPKPVDIKPLTEVLSCKREENIVSLTFRAAAGISTNINPTLYLNAFYEQADIKPHGVRIVRTAIFDEKMQNFC